MTALTPNHMREGNERHLYKRQWRYFGYKTRQVTQRLHKHRRKEKLHKSCTKHNIPKTPLIPKSLATTTNQTLLHKPIKFLDFFSTLFFRYSQNFFQLLFCIEKKCYINPIICPLWQKPILNFSFIFLSKNMFGKLVTNFFKGIHYVTFNSISMVRKRAVKSEEPRFSLWGAIINLFSVAIISLELTLAESNWSVCDILTCSGTESHASTNWSHFS